MIHVSISLAALDAPFVPGEEVRPWTNYQSVWGIAVNEFLAADAAHPLVNYRHNTAIADSALSNIGHE